MQIHIGPETSLFWESHFKLMRSTRWEIPGWDFFGQYGTCLCWQCSNHLWFVVNSGAGRLLNYKEGNTYDQRWFQFGYGSEGERFHATAGRTHYTDEGCAHMQLLLGETREIQLRQNGCTLKRPQPPDTQSSFWTQLWISTVVFMYFFPYQINKLCLIHLLLCVIPVFLKRRKASTSCSSNCTA
jgi:hypothetical protein